MSLPMPTVDISVIIVTFNSADCIAACVESVLAQDDVSFELIVVDNASADDTLARLKNLNCRTLPSRASASARENCRCRSRCPALARRGREIEKSR
jgi:GT2 family glycosyltransferase